MTSPGFNGSWVTEDIEAFHDAARRFIPAELVPYEAQWAAQGYVEPERWRATGSAGLLCPGVSEEYGGGGGSFAHDAVMAYESAYNLAIGMSFSIHSGIVAKYLVNFGTEAQKRTWLPKMAAGEWVGALAMSEPGTGSDVKAITTRAVRSGDYFEVSGAKTFITHGRIADLIVLAVKTDPAAGSKGISLLVVETRGLAGFRRGRTLEKIGFKGQDTAELFFENVRIPVGNLLGDREGLGFGQLMHQLPEERMLIAAGTIGTMDRALKETIAYTRERKVFGNSLGDMQTVRHKLAECKTRATVAKQFFNWCMSQLLARELDGATAAMAKWWCTQVNCEIIDECLQLHGGYGYMAEYPIARMYVNARLGRIYGGTNEIMKEIIARTL